MTRFREKKKLLNGNEVIYECELLTASEKFGILKYILEKKYKVNSLILPKGSTTYAFYWVERPYTLYKWYDINGKILGNYFNIADLIKLTENEFEWRDLVVDVLVSPEGALEVLDEDELPDDIDKKLMRYIENSKNLILQEYKFIIKETDELISM